MKRLILLALVVMAGATFNLALADKKKKKEAKPAMTTSANPPQWLWCAPSTMAPTR